MMLAQTSFIDMVDNNVTVLPAGCTEAGASFSELSGCSSTDSVGTTFIISYLVSLPSCNLVSTVNVRGPLIPARPSHSPAVQWLALLPIATD